MAKNNEPKRIKLELDCAKTVSYRNLIRGDLPVNRLYIKNLTDEDLSDLTVRVESSPEFLLPLRIDSQLLPRSSTLKFESDVKLSPLFFIGLNERTVGKITVEIREGGKLIETKSAEFDLLAFDECDFDSAPSNLAYFVKRTSVVNKILSAAEVKLGEWKAKKFGGYQVGGKNSARYLFAAICAVVSEYKFSLIEYEKNDLIIRSHDELIKSKRATAPEIALLIASAAEAAGLNAVIAEYDRDFSVGAFLIGECFSDIVTDDASAIAKRIEKGVNELSLISIDAIIRSLSFEAGEKEAAAKVKRLSPAFILDIRRARIMKIYPMPERIKTISGYNLSESGDYDVNRAPEMISELDGDFSGDKNITREKQWERKLLDLDMRNPLLNFRPGPFSLKFITASLSDFCSNIADAEYEAVPVSGAGLQYLKEFDSPFDKASRLRPLSDYIKYEYGNGRLVSALTEKECLKHLQNVYRKEKSSLEESGTSSLYLAAGFLKYSAPDDKEFKFAPILLFPVSIARKGATMPRYYLSVNREEAHINYTVTEYLYHQYNIDLRGMSEIRLCEGDNLRAVIDRIRKEIVSLKDWEVYDSVYLCGLVFGNYLMWKDVRTRMDKFRESKLIRSLLDNRSYFTGAELLSENYSSDSAVKGEDRIYLPINADSSQFSAIADSLSRSFVLHGPPGTGKSQTITNIIVNNIVRGKRVLFVAEKAAALDVVAKRLKDIGVEDFCLRLYSDKTKKTEVAQKLSHTLSLKTLLPQSGYDAARGELNALTEKLSGELEAMHRKQSLGFSIYEGILEYLYNQDAPDCLHIDNIFYEKLTAKSYAEYLELLSELAVRAKECGNLDKSPFKRVGLFEYTKKWRVRGEAALDVYQKELKHLRDYAKSISPAFNLRTTSLTGRKLQSLYDIMVLLDDFAVKAFFDSPDKGDSYGEITGYLTAAAMRVKSETAFAKSFGSVPTITDYEEIAEAEKNDKAALRIAKKYAALCKYELNKENREGFFVALSKLAKNRSAFFKRGESVALLLRQNDKDENAVLRAAGAVKKLYDAAKQLYSDFDEALLRESCKFIYDNEPFILKDYYCGAYRVCLKAEEEFRRVYRIEGDDNNEEDILQRIAFLDELKNNLDLMPSWCKYREIVDKCEKNGFGFVLEPLMRGEITASDILRCFKKCVFKNFVQNEIALDDRLCSFSGMSLEQTIETFRKKVEEFERITRDEIYFKLIDRLPSPEQEGAHNLEKVVLARAEKTDMKGITLRKLFTDIPEILKYTAPCMLMSPTTVTQFLDLDAQKFDLVVFDEASQVPTCKAVGTIARAERVIVVGDPKQLPPTTFFGADFKDDEVVEVEDLDSILDDCLAIGMPERHLLWHYRSRHESLIAFSNAMYYDNKLLTFPSPSEKESVVSLRYIDGIYDRGGKKINKKEADELIKEVVKRLKDGRKQSVGIVTFNTAQQNYIYDKLSNAIREYGLESAAYDVSEPVFVKNLENVQGDERDIIMFSVGYGPDAEGKLSLNFGPLNQSNGYRRLNVAVTRARAEMIVFSSITGNMIDLNRTDSAGVRGLKAFLEYAERGRDMLVFDRKDVGNRERGIGELIARDLKSKGVQCEYDLGVSDFRIDAAVVDPKNPDKYILAVICDGENERRINSVKDRVSMQTKILKTLGWNVYYMWTVNYFGNPKREIQKLRDYIQKLTETKTANKKSVAEAKAKYRRPYKAYSARPLLKSGPEFVLSGLNNEAIIRRAKAIIETEQPIEEQCLVEKLACIYNVPKTNRKAYAALCAAIGELGAMRKETEDGAYYMTDEPRTFRAIDPRVKRDFGKIYLGEIAAAVRCAVEGKLTLSSEELIAETAALFNLTRRTKAVNERIERAINLAVSNNFIIATIDGKFTI